MSEYIKIEDELYRQRIDPWANLNKSHPRYNLWHQCLIVMTSMILPRYHVIVDLGCGVGGLVNMIDQMEDKIAIGVDSSTSAIKQAKNFFPDLQFEVADAREWQPKTKVDMAIISGFYHHMPAIERFALLKHIHSYLNEEGALMVRLPANKFLSGKTRDNYPEIASELFSVFKPQQHIQFMMIDNSMPTKILGDKLEEGTWHLYVGEK